MKYHKHNPFVSLLLMVVAAMLAVTEPPAILLKEVSRTVRRAYWRRFLRFHGIAGIAGGMYVDSLLLLSDAQVVESTEVSTNTIDLAAARKVWGGKQLYVVIIVDVSFETSTSVNFQVVTDSDAALGSPTVQVETGAIAIASLTAGRAPIVIPIGSALGTEERYLGLQYTVAGSAGTLGAVTAFVAFDAPGNP